MPGQTRRVRDGETMFLIVDSWRVASSQCGRLDCGAQMAKFRLIFGFSPKADKEPGLGCLSLGSSAPNTHSSACRAPREV